MPRGAIRRYWPQYKWANVLAMIKNIKEESKQCEKSFRDRRGRIIFVGSEGYRFAAWGLDLEDLQWEGRKYSGIKAYGAGNLAQLLSMHRFAEDLKLYNVTVNAMHPGIVRTETGKDNGRFYQWYKRNIIDKNSAAPEISAKALWVRTMELLPGKGVML